MREFISKLCSLEDKCVFVAGHEGLVGSSVVRRLQDEECEILTAPRQFLDLRDYKAVLNFFQSRKPHIVVMAAASVGGIGANVDRPADFLSDNLLIQASVMRAAHAVGIEKLVFLGSSCIYPKDAVQPIKEEALAQGILEPTNEAYALAKIAGIRMVQAYRAQYECDYISLMPCNIYGPGDRFDLERSHVIPALMMKAHAAKIFGEDFVVWGSGTPLREFLYVDDLAEAIVFCLRNYSSEKILNVGSGEEISITDLAMTIADVVGFKGKLIYDHDKPDGVARKVMDSSRIKEAGWEPKTHLELGLEKMYDWYGRHIVNQEVA